ncbi:MAG: NUDIX hydrolase [Rhodoferax sp.]|uniref:NUDIX hydrolase n=1 Tax=Rhodoferax sp. TaxID=50421 RepID=UPI00326467E1
MDTRWKPHATVAAVIERDGRFLLVEEETADGLRLNNPAGHLDRGETLAEACVRETLEETAHTFTPTALVGVYQAALGGTTYLRFAFCGTLGDFHPERKLDHGIQRTLWMSPAEIRASSHRHRSPMLLRCVEDYLAGRRFPMDLVYTAPG